MSSPAYSIVRMVPASFGLAYFTFILNRQETIHYADTAARINIQTTASHLTMARLHAMGAGALRYLAGFVQVQAMAKSVDDIFFISGIFLLAAVPFTLLLAKKRTEQARRNEEARLAARGMAN